MDRRYFILTANRIPSSQGKNSHWLKSCATVCTVVLLFFFFWPWPELFPQPWLYIYTKNQQHNPAYELKYQSIHHTIAHLTKGNSYLLRYSSLGNARDGSPVGSASIYFLSRGSKHISFISAWLPGVSPLLLSDNELCIFAYVRRVCVWLQTRERRRGPRLPCVARCRFSISHKIWFVCSESPYDIWIQS